MLDLGIQELIVIFIVALIVFGPKRLPELGRTLGKGIAELKKSLSGFKEQMNSEIHESDNFLSLEDKLHKTDRPHEDKSRQTASIGESSATPDENKG